MKTMQDGRSKVTKLPITLGHKISGYNRSYRPRQTGLSHSVTHELPLDQINQGLEMLKKKDQDLIRLVVSFP